MSQVSNQLKLKLKQYMPELNKNFLSFMNEHYIEDLVNENFGFLTGRKRCEIIMLMNESFLNGQICYKQHVENIQNNSNLNKDK
jgi:hypothetical protein